MEFLASLPTYGQDQAVINIWEELSHLLDGIEGICYYKHPVIVSTRNLTPELTLLARGYEPLAIKCLNHTLDEITEVEYDFWTINGFALDSPLLELDDYVEGLDIRFRKNTRELRGYFKPAAALVLPHISKAEFETEFGPIEDGVKVIWRGESLKEALIPLEEKLNDELWNLAKSVFQGISVLNKPGSRLAKDSTKLGDVIIQLEKEIALLDAQQHSVAIQIAPGPQRIRGLAGTGKTVVLAMKAANIHLHYPDKKILFTFHTQSLYNQAKSLITRFYRLHSDEDPDWDFLHIRHSWGGANRPGVYSDVCKRYALKPLSLQDARRINSDFPLQAICQHALSSIPQSEPFYDYILVDEAQDFPQEFFHLLYQLSKENPEEGTGKCIYWAYDELQSLSALEIPRPEELFGTDSLGKPRVSLEGEYAGGIEKDFVLNKSYRCTLQVLMLAHGIGLGIYGARGCVQMFPNKGSWGPIGYELITGGVHVGEETIVYRPPENSPNRLEKLYKGKQKFVQVKVFNTRDEELDWVASSIENDIRVEGVKPEHIVVITLDSRNSKDDFSNLQYRLFEKNIHATIPGLVNDSAMFAEPDTVTLSTLYRAKGNEAPIIYIVGFEFLNNYTEEIENRNRAFTSISRAKGWVRISGIGKEMKLVEQEINSILADIPYFKFKFPDPSKIRRLDAAETTRRRQTVKNAATLLARLSKIAEKDALAAAIKENPELRHVLETLSELKDEVSE